MSTSPGCRNSYEERCGDFYWDYDPDTLSNAPLEITYIQDPEDPVVDEPIRIELTLRDPDHGDNCLSEPLTAPGVSGLPYGPGCTIAGCPAPEPEPHGPWDPPPPPGPAPEPDVVWMEPVYSEPGEYEITVAASGNLACGGPWEFPGYTSEATLTIPISVGER